MKRFIILLVLIIGFSYMYSCTGCSKSGRLSQHNKQLVVKLGENEIVPSYYIITNIYKPDSFIGKDIVAYVAKASINPSYRTFDDKIKFYEYSNSFIIGDTIQFKYYERNKKAKE